MKIRSALLTEMSGKLGNAVASKARGGITYFRALVTPSNPRTFLQNAIRQALISVATYWKTFLTELQQEAWWDLAEGGQTGQTLFTRVNQPRIYAVNTLRVTDATATPPDDPMSFILVPPPDFNTTFTPPTVVIDDSANTLTISNLNVLDPWLADSDTPAAGTLFVYASHQQTSSRLSRQHPYQLIKAYRFAAPVTTPTTPINLAALGFTTEAGKLMYVKIVAQHPTGGISLPIEQRITIVA